MENFEAVVNTQVNIAFWTEIQCFRILLAVRYNLVAATGTSASMRRLESKVFPMKSFYSRSSSSTFSAGQTDGTFWACLQGKQRLNQLMPSAVRNSLCELMSLSLMLVRKMIHELSIEMSIIRQMIFFPPLQGSPLCEAIVADVLVSNIHSTHEGVVITYAGRAWNWQLLTTALWPLHHHTYGSTMCC